MYKHWVITDIHGCVNTLFALIENQIKPNSTDHFYFLGDYIDRGPDSKGVIDLLISMKESGYCMSFLKGNHEDCFLKAWDWEVKSVSKGFFKKKNPYENIWMEYGGKHTLKSFGFGKLIQVPSYYIAWIKELKYYLEIEKFILVHAGLNFKKDNPLEDKDAMLWLRDYRIVPERINYRKIIHGHVPVSLDFIEFNIKNNRYPFIALDNGVYMKGIPGFGNLIALELNSMEFKVQPNID